MIVSYQGGDSFKVSQGDLMVAINPKSKLSADVTIFTNKKSPDYAEAAEGKVGFVVDGPGEYEVKNVFIKGFLNKTFLVTFEGIKLCFLGSGDGKEEVESADILFVPVGAYKSAVALEPAIMIPMNYDPSTSSGQVSLKQFLRDAGEKNGEAIDKLVVKKKDLEGKEGEIIILKEE